MSVDPKIVQRFDHIFSRANTHEDAARALSAEFVVIPRSELPEVTDTNNTFGVHGASYSKIIPRKVRRADALIHLALAEYLEAEEAIREARETESKRTARRNDLARQFSRYGNPYGSVSRTAQAAIDKIIELEQSAP